jgi:hypothetical protein
MKREYTYTQLAAAFDRHGIGKLYAYSVNGFAGAYDIRRERDLQALPRNLVYIWAN